MMTENDLDRLSVVVGAYARARFTLRGLTTEWGTVVEVVQSIIDRHVSEALDEEEPQR